MEIRNYLSLIKFSHTIFAVPFAIIGFLLAATLNNSSFDLPLFLKVLLCMVFARSAAMAFNRYIDKNIDSLNPRTKNREIPAGIIKASSALLFVILNCLLFITTTWFINEICFYLSPIALFLVLGYSFTKRFTSLCHIILGAGLSLAPIGSYLAVTGKFDILPVLFSLSVLFWVSGFDIIYALQDEEFDKTNNLKSIPVLIGKKKALLLSSIFHIITVAFIIGAGYTGKFELWYWIGSGLFSGLLIYQHSLVGPDNLSKVNIAFFTTNGIAGVLFAVFVFLELYFQIRLPF